MATLLSRWATELDLPEMERTRWAAAGWLHDALRDAPPAELRLLLPPEDAELPAATLHGPAAALRLGDDADPALRTAVRYHTFGHPDLDHLGRALYLADFLEPGREFEVEWRAELAARMPHDMDRVLVEVLASRLQFLIAARRALRMETVAFWSAAIAGA